MTLFAGGTLSPGDLQRVPNRARFETFSFCQSQARD